MFVALLLACSTASQPPVATPSPPAPAVAPAADNVFLGDPVDGARALPIDVVLASASAYDGKEVVVEGTVKEVCQKKGCWHTIATASPDVSVMVKDKEYKVFLPKDAAGRRVHVGGTFALVETPEAEARHYAEDAGRDPSLVVGPQRGYAIDVSGVQFIEG